MAIKTCFFIGHREATEEIYPLLAKEVERHGAELGVEVFVVGQYGAFDRMVARAVLAAKKKYPWIKLTILLAYHPTERKLSAPDGYDGTFYPPGLERVPRRYAIVRANRYMLDHSDFLIAYAWHPGSCARDLLEYARAKEKRGEICVTACKGDADKILDLK